MSTLDKVISMQQQGYSDTDISRQLQEQGVSPFEIQNSLNQAKIKTAVSGNSNNIPNPPENPQSQEVLEAPPIEPMQESAQKQSAQPSLPPEAPIPPIQEPNQEQYPSQEDYYAQSPQAYSSQEPQAYSSQDYPQRYSQEDYYSPASVVDTQTISEIASQISSEKIEEFKEEVGDIKSFKESSKEKMANIDERLKRIEKSIENLTHSIIGKIGEFGQNTSLIHKDIDNLHETMSKLMNPIIDHQRKETRHKSPKAHHHSKKKKN